MTVIYEATAYPTPARDFADLADARAFIEEKGEGRIVTFVRDFDGRDRSAGMEVYKEGMWTGVNIHE